VSGVVFGAASCEDALMGAWRNFDPDQLKAIGTVLPPLGEPAGAVQCPSCANLTLHWYGYLNPFREGSMISYEWCSACRRYHGQTYALEDWDLPDPFDGGRDDTGEMEGDFDKFFGALDELWKSGDLPQVRMTRGDFGPGSPGRT
jgi:hypothetical protein